MMFLNRLLIYSYNDMVYTFLKSQSLYDKNSYFAGYTPTLLGSNIKADHLTTLIWQLLSSFVPPVLLNNLFIIVALLLSIIFSYIFFKKITNDRPTSILFSLFYSFSLYFVFRVISATYSLYLMFVFPTLIHFLYMKKKPFIVGLFILFSLLLSSYYGNFLFITAVFWYLGDLILVRSTKKDKLISVFKNILLLSGSVSVVIFIVFGNILLSNSPVFTNYERVDRTKWDSTSIVYRPLEDFYNFSFRPWYFVIPPNASVFFGALSKQVYGYIESTGYYLADDYDEEEMGGTYLGWHLILGVLFVGAILLGKNVFNRQYSIFTPIYNNADIIKRSFLILILLLSITGPPSFTIAGQVFYTPSYLLYFFVPVFRVLVRFSIVLYLFILIINCYLFLSLYKYLAKWNGKVLVVAVTLLLQIVVFSVYLPLVDLAVPPKEVEALKNGSEKRFSYAVYPKGDYYSIFWILDHGKYLVNPEGIVISEKFNSDEFSKNLVTPEGINNLRALKTEYLIFYGNKVDLSLLEKIGDRNKNIKSKQNLTSFFSKELGNPVYSEGDVLIYKIN